MGQQGKEKHSNTRCRKGKTPSHTGGDTERNRVTQDGGAAHNDTLSQEGKDRQTDRHTGGGAAYNDSLLHRRGKEKQTLSQGGEGERHGKIPSHKQV
ncbi:hypothetical protein FKM82_013522 [Ascaphus truei]